jgi:hypothetical protein
VAIEFRFNGIREQISMGHRAQWAIDMDRLTAHAAQCFDVQVESTTDFTLMARTIKVHERHAAAPTFDPRRCAVSIPMRRM